MTQGKDEAQMHLELEEGLASRYRDLRECFATCVYRTGLGRVAAAVDLAPSNLSAMLSGERNLDTRYIERYMEKFGDTEPAHYMAARWLPDAKQIQAQAAARIPGLVDELTRVLEIAEGRK